jgi:DNA-binding MarR family transcriptional regulator
MKPIEDILQMPPIEDPYLRLHVNLLYTGGWLQNRFTQLLKPYGISEPQFNVLRILRGQRGAAMSLLEVQQRMVHPDSNVSRLIDKLVEKKLVSRVPRESNRRKVDLFITEQGMSLLEQMDPIVNDQRQDLLGMLKPEEAITLGRLLDRIRDQE